MLALISAALEGLAAIKAFYFEFKSLNLKSTLDGLYENQQKIMAGHIAMASAKNQEEMRAALHQIYDSK